MSSQERIKVIASKVDRDHLHSKMNHLHLKMNICTEFKGPRSILSVVLIWTRFGQSRSLS